MRVICTIPGVPLVINNHEFTAVDGGVLSPELPEDEALSLATIPGYEIYAEQAQDPEPTPEPEPAPKPRRGRPPKAAADEPAP